ncbi:MAG TPA: hypothetical protein EYQ22_00045 [Gammaproteobacteria bacterium]|nr:hypothetical protein [Gammaproteobacteria bacterium]HIK70281.1 hypothetical protein [Pseudomonadales bacterium]
MKYQCSRIIGILLCFGVPALAESAPEPISSDSDLHQFYAEDIKAAVSVHIADQLDNEGIFLIKDEQTEEMLSLRFIKVHDPVRQIGSSIYFACTDFHVVGKPKKIYDIDFWLSPESGELEVYQTKIHKEPRWSLIYGWYKQPRYTFVNDEISYLY